MNNFKNKFYQTINLLFYSYTFKSTDFFSGFRYGIGENTETDTEIPNFF